ncbi:hypothetical protein OKW38_003628 [Paraburkholderia sp. MM5496-R1]|uniref:hypothetical protein n=1 Tax=Paraburkholderia sp. MM5496-R1 TaxID=2991065 RepID=UPI003D20BAC1
MYGSERFGRASVCLSIRFHAIPASRYHDRIVCLRGFSISNDTITLGGAGYDCLRQCAGLADVLLDQLEAVLCLDDVGRTARELLRLDAARETAEQLANLGGTQPGIEGVEAALGH